MQHPRLPPQFLNDLAELERSYLVETDPARQSGFGGGPERWYAERSPVLDALPGSCEMLDVGCANGYLLECLVRWGEARALKLTPFGLDCGAGLIEMARQRLPQYASNFFVGNAWEWTPARRFACVYTLFDCVPQSYFGAYVRRLLTRVVATGGRLIVGAYGSRARREAPAAVESMLVELGLQVAGMRRAGEPETARIAWVNR